jgi:cyclic lactone autoinducer peptide
MKRQVESKRLDQLAVKAIANLARGIAEDSVNGRCFGFVHQPEEPKDLAKRLKTMK